MTFLDKAKQAHNISNEEHTIQDLCPSDLGYEAKIKCKAIIGADTKDKAYICRRCWEREMPDAEQKKMQNDLISRSEVEKMIHDYFINCVENGKYEVDITEANAELQETLSELPTAYSVEKVVAELEKEKQRLKTLKNDCIALCDSEVIAIEEKAYNFAIDIVRNGGKE